MRPTKRIRFLAVSCTLSLCMVLAALFTPTLAFFSRRTAEESAVQTFSKSAGVGDIVTFSQQDFESRVTGDDSLSGIVLSALPDEESGILRLAGRGVSQGETIAVESLGALSFIPLTEDDIHTSFSFIPVFADSGESGDSVSVAVNLSGTQNSNPIARDLSFEAYLDLPLCGVFSSLDPDGDACTYKVLTDPSNGAVTLTDTGFCYTPDGRAGSDSFTYQAIDVFGNPSAAATVTVEVLKRSADSDITYTDMGQSTAHYQAVKLAEAGVLTGERIGSESFLKPELEVTRAEFVALVASVVELPLPTAAVSTGLADNEAIPTWAQPYVAAAVSSGVVYGQKGEDGNHIFRAGDTITRAEAASIIQRAARMTADGRTLTYADADAVPSWAAQAVATVSAAEIMESYPDHTIRPTAAVTREDAVKMLYETMCYLQEKGEGVLGN